MDVIRDKIYEFSEFYEWALSVSDKRVGNWLLMQGYAPTLGLTVLYLVLVFGGKKWMESREAFKFKYTLVAYNFICIAINFHICSQLFIYTTKRNYSYSCQPVDYSDDKDELQIAKAIWWFYFSKLVEMLDTIFFILRKKNGQVSFLHVYHHATMFPIWWMGVKWVAGGQSFFGAMVNSFIHVVMYTYYGVAAMGPQFQKYLWWKKYLTIMQLTQFAVGLVYGLQTMYFECDYPRWMQWASMIYGITIIILFINFYIQEYIIKSAKTQFIGAGIVHPIQSLFFDCDYPNWMQWCLITYAITIFSLFMNFYLHAYVKSSKHKKASASKPVENGQCVSNGHIGSGDATSNGKVEKKKDK